MSGDLISKAKALEIIDSRLNSSKEGTLERQRLHSIYISVLEVPAAYDLDGVIGKLEQQKEQYLQRQEEIERRFGENYESQRNFSKACSYDNAIEIVKAGLV